MIGAAGLALSVIAIYLAAIGLLEWVWRKWDNRRIDKRLRRFENRAREVAKRFRNSQ